MPAALRPDLLRIGPAVCFEVKPKAGFIPSSRHIARAHAVKLGAPRFRLHQLLKHLKGKAPAISRYSPLDLFGGPPELQEAALAALMECPSNNLKVFVEGRLVFGGKHGAHGARADGAAAAAAEPSILVDHLDFSYPGLDGRPIPGQPPLITDMTLSLAPGSRCLLIGANGAGKTTLLKILGGKHMVQKECVSVLGRPPFHDTSLTTCGDLAYIGGNWTRDIAFAGTAIPLTGDFPASKMIESVPGVDPARRARLIKVLDIDPAWRMHQVSDGQRRRVQICVGLLKPFKVLLLDEITVDLDVLGRADLMAFLAEECRERGAAIIYATHIFDGLESWPTHLAYVARGRLQFVAPAAQVPQLREGRLLELVAGLLREERDALRRAGLKRDVEYDPSREGAVGAFSYAFNNGWTPGVLSTSLANSSNAVMRC